MALSKVNITVQDGNLGIPSAGTQACVRVGVCTSGTPGTLYSISSTSSVVSTLGVGPGAARVGFALSASGGPVLFLPVEPDVAGSVGSVTHAGTGTGTLAVSTAPCRQITLVYTATGAPGVGKYKVALGSDAYGPEQVIPGNADGYAVRIPGTFTTLTFTGNGTYTSGDGYIFDTLGGSSKSGTSSGITAASDPVDDFNVSLTVSTAGAVGTAKVTVSLDGYGQVGGATLLSSAVALSLPNTSYTTGLVVTPTGTFVANDVYSFQTCAPTATDSGQETTFTDLQTQTPFSMVHFDNKHATATEAAAFYSNVDSVCTSLFGQNRFVRAMMNTPSAGSVATVGGVLTLNTDTISTIETAFVNAASTRVGCGAYDEIIADPITGLKLRRNFSWSAMERLCLIEPVLAASWVGLGALSPAPVAVSANEFYSEGLSDAGFTVPTSIQGRSGIFVNQALTFSYKNNSVYSYFEDCRVMDLACTIAYAVIVDYLNAAVLVDSKTGKIQEQQARIIENKINNALNAGLINTIPQEATAATASIDRTNDLLTSQELNVTIDVTPAAHLRNINVTIGFGLQS